MVNMTCMHNFLCVHRFLKNLGDAGDDFMGRAFMPISVCAIILRIYRMQVRM